MNGRSNAGSNAGMIASGIGLVLLVVVIFQNHGDTKIKFLGWSLTMPLWLYTIIVAVVGALAWVGFGIARRRRRRRSRR
jgi:uncharacterized integral membrane protein